VPAVLRATTVAFRAAQQDAHPKALQEKSHLREFCFRLIRVGWDKFRNPKAMREGRGIGLWLQVLLKMSADVPLSMELVDAMKRDGFSPRWGWQLYRDTCHLVTDTWQYHLELDEEFRSSMMSQQSHMASAVPRTLHLAPRLCSQLLQLSPALRSLSRQASLSLP
jgi:hypothetical protein